MPRVVSPERVAVGSVLVRRKARGLVRHRGIYLGDGWVFENRPRTGERITTYEEFARGRRVAYKKAPELPLTELYARVNAAAGSGRGYNLFTNNCDHAVSRILKGKPRSFQLAAWSTAAVLLALSLLP